MSKEKMISDLQNMIDVQCTDGNWNYDRYMHGMANGLICALSVLTDKDPKYLDAPDKWICDLPKGKCLPVVSKS